MSVELTTLGEFIKVQGGFAFKSNDFSESGSHPVLKIKNIRFGTIDYSDTSFISKEIANETKDWCTKEGDILISMTGSGPNAPQSLVGRVARVWANEPKAWINQRVGRIVLKFESSIHKDFIYYLLTSPRSQEFLVSNSSGSANQANISSKTIESLPCPKLNFIQSKNVATILRSIDQKIIINTQINQTLEQIAQAIFKSWFVDFDPVKVKIAILETGGTQDAAELAAMSVISGKDEAQLAQLKVQDADAYQQLAQTVVLFPAAMQESELGEIPDGWEVKCLNDISSLITKGSTPTKTDLISAIDEPTIPLIKVKDILGTKEIDVSNLELISSSIHLGSLKRSILKVNDLLFSIAGTIGRVSVVEKELDNSNCNQAVGIIRLNNPILYWNLVWLSLNSERVQNDIQSKVVQGVQANASLQNLKDIKIVIASKDVMDLYNTTIENLIIKIRENQRESRVLVQLRDSLLPKLLSGEITIPDFENSQKEIAE